ncbi:MAG: hypothetical protein IJH76_04195 [Clostridia bacterium]|nr:hypothetical protein [Clostridia bacterium]
MNTKNVKHNPKSRRHGKKRLKPIWKFTFPVFGVVLLAAIAIKVITPDTVVIPDDSSKTELLAPTMTTKNLPKDSTHTESETDPVSDYWTQVYSDVSALDKAEWSKQAENFGHYTGPIMSEEDVNLLTQAVLHETAIFIGKPDCDKIMQYMAASIYNRIGQEGFGPDMSYADCLTTVLSNRGQYKNILNELAQFDPYEETARRNVLTVLKGEAKTPKYLYFEDCSDIYYIDLDATESYVDSDGDLIWTYEAAKADAEKEFKSHYSSAKEFTVSYSALSPEGRFIMFGCNPYGAYATP